MKKKNEYHWHENANGYRPGSLDDYEPVHLSRREMHKIKNEKVKDDMNKEHDDHMKDVFKGSVK